MKNIQKVTYDLDKKLVEKAREEAKTLSMSFDEYVNEALRTWLESKSKNKK